MFAFERRKNKKMYEKGEHEMNENVVGVVLIPAYYNDRNHNQIKSETKKGEKNGSSASEWSRKFTSFVRLVICVDKCVSV